VLVESIVSEFLTRDFKDFHVLEKIEGVTLFAKNILNADSVIVWFESEDRGSFWSHDDKRQIFLEKDRIEPILGNRTNVYLNRDEHLGFIEEMQTISKVKYIRNTMFYKIHCLDCRRELIVQTINLHDEPITFKRGVEDVVQILSLFVSQTVQMKDIFNLARYYFEEQEKAYIKQKTVIQNDFENSKQFFVDLFYQPSDILSGDSYSLLQANNGDILVYIVDAMGHGIGPSLTAYSISAIMQHKIKNSSSFNELMQTLLDNVQYILTDEEQLTCGFFWFSSDLKKVDYVVAGMYAPMILDGDKVISAKANNIPFMNFAFDFSITSLELEDFRKFLIFTDGLVEDTKELDINLEKMLRDSSYSQSVFHKLEYTELEDDTTVVLFGKRGFI
jgi:serine phosphatase RsbU (regulator of sigma subunit)